MNHFQEGDDISGSWHESIDASAGLSALEDNEEYIPQRYGFQVGGLGLLLPEGKLSEVVMDYVVHPIPNTQKWFIGMINMRGNLVPVLDIGMLLGSSVEDDHVCNRKLLLLDSAEKAVCILIDDLPVTISLEQPEEQAQDLPNLLAEYTGDAFGDHNQVWTEFDIDALFTEIGSMASFE